ncbi:unnamed protein product [Amoebophrya sp. A120]|nr:unnamed protein product [Amoebophrya sp. A120]|eukprot:GSA120T00026004001.1
MLATTKEKAPRGVMLSALAVLGAAYFAPGLVHGVGLRAGAGSAANSEDPQVIREECRPRLVFVETARTELNQLAPVKDALRNFYGYNDAAEVPQQNFDNTDTLNGLGLPAGSPDMAMATEARTLQDRTPLRAADGATPLGEVVAGCIEGFQRVLWKFFSAFRDRVPEEKERRRIAQRLLAAWGVPLRKGKSPLEERRPIHIVVDFLYPGAAFLGLLAEFLEDPRVFPAGGKLFAWVGTPILAVGALSWTGSTAAADAAAVADMHKLNFVAPTGPYLPGGGDAAAVVRLLLRLPGGPSEGEEVSRPFPDWFPVDRICAALPWFPRDNVALAEGGYERLVAGGTAGEPVHSIFAGDDQAFAKRVFWLNTGAPPAGAPEAVTDVAPEVAELEALALAGAGAGPTTSGAGAAGAPGQQVVLAKPPKTLVFVALGTTGGVPLVGGGNKGERRLPYKEMLEDLLSLGEEYVVAVRVAYPGGQAEQEKVQTPADILAALTENGTGQATVKLYEGHFPQKALLGARSARENRLIFVSHGGISSLSEALRARVPTVLMPQSEEQLANDKLMVAHGLGVDASQAGANYEVYGAERKAFPQKWALPAQYATDDASTSSQTAGFAKLSEAVAAVAARKKVLRENIDAFATEMKKKALAVEELAKMLATPGNAPQL